MPVFDLNKMSGSLPISYFDKEDKTVLAIDGYNSYENSTSFVTLTLEDNSTLKIKSKSLFKVSRENVEWFYIRKEYHSRTKSSYIHLYKREEDECYSLSSYGGNEDNQYTCYNSYGHQIIFVFLEGKLLVKFFCGYIVEVIGDSISDCFKKLFPGKVILVPKNISPRTEKYLDFESHLKYNHFILLNCGN